MITATCNNDKCTQNSIDYNFAGEPLTVECGQCGVNCDLTNLRPDLIAEATDETSTAN